MSKLPETTFSLESINTRKEAVNAVDELLQRNVDLEEIYNQLQPLLFALSVKLYGENAETITLQQLIEDSVHWIEKGVLQ